jgi:hypothetical protein
MSAHREASPAVRASLVATRAERRACVRIVDDLASEIAARACLLTDDDAGRDAADQAVQLLAEVCRRIEAPRRGRR